MKTFTAIALWGFIAIVIGIVAVGSHNSTLTSASAQAPDPNWQVNGAIMACKAWTNTHSKLGVGEYVDEFTLTGKTKPNHYRVGVQYRAQGSGLLMQSDCEYQSIGKSLFLVKANSGPR